MGKKMDWTVNNLKQKLETDILDENARIELEQKTGKSVITPLNARDGIGLETDTKTSVLLENKEEKWANGKIG